MTEWTSFLTGFGWYFMGSLALYAAVCLSCPENRQ